MPVFDTALIHAREAAPEALGWKDGSSMAETKRGLYYIEAIAPGSYKIYERREATMYLVCGSERACLIDTAYGLSDLKALMQGLTNLPVTVVNTHGHSDHVLGNHWFYDNGKSRVYLNPADRPLYEEIVSGYAAMLNEPWVKETYGEFIRDVDPTAVHFPRTEDICEEDVIDLGGKKLEIIGIPGHTAGSILLIDRDEGICYAGDSIMENMWLFLEESLPMEIYLGALRRARDVLDRAGVQRIYNGHYSHVPLTVPQIDNMISGLEQILAGSAKGEPFENRVGSGIRYTFGEWSVLCRDSANPPLAFGG